MRKFLAVFAGLMFAAAVPAQETPPPADTAAPAAAAAPAAVDPAAQAAANIVVPIAPPPATPDNIWVLDLSTGGQVRVQLRPDAAPGHVERIKTLTRQGFYNGLVFHRVIEGFMAQGGDPQGTGQGGSSLPDLRAEFNNLPHVRGAAAMARAEHPNSANSQFFLMFGPRLALDGKYTIFGRVISGMEYVDAIERGEPPATPSRVIRASILADGGDAPRIVAAPVEQLTGEQPKP